MIDRLIMGSWNPPLPPPPRPFLPPKKLVTIVFAEYFSPFNFLHPSCAGDGYRGEPWATKWATSGPTEWRTKQPGCWSPQRCCLQTCPVRGRTQGLLFSACSVWVVVQISGLKSVQTDGLITNLLSVLCVLTEILSCAHAKGEWSLSDFKFGTFIGHFPNG